LTTDGDAAWLVDASYDAGQVSLRFVRAGDLETIQWADSFQPYYLMEGEHSDETVRKVNLFTQETVSLQKVNYLKKPPKDVHAWEAEIDPTLSYVYDHGLRFGLLHAFKDDHWLPQASLDAEQSSRFDRLFDDLREKDPLKYGLVKEAYTHTSQPVPRISGTTLGITDSGGTEEEYYNAFLLSRLANLPIPRTYRNHAVSDWIRSMLYTYYRAHNILIPTSEEQKLGDKRKFVTGALTIAPESGEYFNMVVLDYESLYPGCIDVFNLSYETVRCSHPECQKNNVPGLDYCICTRRRGIYSALTGALRDLRLRVFKPLLKTEHPESEKSLSAGSRTLKLFLVSCFGVTVRIHGLASPLLAEAITAYGRHVLQSTWDMAKESRLKPKYGDTDSVFLDNPPRDDVERFVESVRNRFGLQLAYDRAYAVCVLSSAKKAYFGILPNGEPEIKGLAIAKSNSPRFFQETFQKCLAKLSEGRQSADDFQLAKQHVPDVVKDAIRALREGRVPLSDLEYRVELRDDPREKSKAKTLPQAYQAATLLLKEGKEVPQGGVVGFVKVQRFRFPGRQFTVKPTTQADTKEISVSDYIRNLSSSLAQTFEPMGIKIELPETDLSEFL
jgi:DNA polymerase elongation subunit (family B)